MDHQNLVVVHVYIYIEQRGAQFAFEAIARVLGVHLFSHLPILDKIIRDALTPSGSAFNE
jgi:hypothetical protein